MHSDVCGCGSSVQHSGAKLRLDLGARCGPALCRWLRCGSLFLFNGWQRWGVRQQLGSILSIQGGQLKRRCWGLIWWWSGRAEGVLGQLGSRAGQPLSRAGQLGAGGAAGLGCQVGVNGQALGQGGRGGRCDGRLNVWYLIDVPRPLSRHGVHWAGSGLILRRFWRWQRLRSRQRSHHLQSNQSIQLLEHPHTFCVLLLKVNVHAEGLSAVCGRCGFIV